MGNGGRWCLKCLLLLFNVIYLILGIVIISVGGYCLHVVQSNYNELVGNGFTIACVVFLILGICSFLAGVFGCCGAIRENRCCLILFSVCIAVLLLVALALGIIWFAFGSFFSHITSTAANALQDAVITYNPSDDSARTWDNLQHSVGCCGIKGPYDWKNATQLPKKSVPDSCCRVNVLGCGKDALNGRTVDDDEYYTKGCLEVIEDYLVSKVNMVGGICFGIALFEILGIVISCCLICTIRDSYSV